MIGFSDGGATGEVSSEIQREQCIQIGVRRHWNHVHSSYIWSFAGAISNRSGILLLLLFFFVCN